MGFILGGLEEWIPIVFPIHSNPAIQGRVKIPLSLCRAAL